MVRTFLPRMDVSNRFKFAWYDKDNPEAREKKLKRKAEKRAIKKKERTLQNAVDSSEGNESGVPNRREGNESGCKRINKSAIKS